jgi:hypothetical protein
VGGLEIAGCHFVKHRSKKSEVISADEGYLDIRTFRLRAIEVFCDLYAGESAPQDNDLSFSGFPIDFVHYAHIPQVRKFVGSRQAAQPPQIAHDKCVVQFIGFNYRAVADNS